MSAPPIASVSSKPARPAHVRRVSLRVKALALATLPALLMGVLVALILTVQHAAALGAAARNLADSVASILATTLDVQDLTQVDAQLQAAVSSQSVGFIDLRPAGQEGLRFFRSQAPETDWYLRGAYDAFAGSAPGSAQFRFRDDRARAYRDAARALAGARVPDSVRQHLGAAATRLEASRGQATDYRVTRVEVYSAPGGGRALHFLNQTGVGQPEPQGQLLFTLGIGVRQGELAGVLDRQLSLVLLACALVLTLAVLVASAAARRLVAPILALTAATHRVSLGHMDTHVETRSNDELDELARSVERLRVSLQLALSRLRPQGGR